MSVAKIPDIPDRIGDAGSYQELLHTILTAMKARIESLETAQGAAGEDSTKKLTALEEKLNGFETRLETAESAAEKIDGFETQIGELGTRLTAAEEAAEKVSQLETKQGEFETRLAALETPEA